MQKIYELIKMGYVMSISQINEDMVRIAFTRVSLSEGVRNFRLQAELSPEDFCDESSERWKAVLAACQLHIENPPESSPHII